MRKPSEWTAFCWWDGWCVALSFDNDGDDVGLADDGDGVFLMSLDYTLFYCDLTLKRGGKVFMQKDTDIE